MAERLGDVGPLRHPQALQVDRLEVWCPLPAHGDLQVGYQIYVYGKGPLVFKRSGTRWDFP